MVSLSASFNSTLQPDSVWSNSFEYKNLKQLLEANYTFIRQASSGTPSIIHGRHGWNPKAGWKWENNDSFFFFSFRNAHKGGGQESVEMSGPEWELSAWDNSVIDFLNFAWKKKKSMTIRVVMLKSTLPFISSALSSHTYSVEPNLFEWNALPF